MKKPKKVRNYLGLALVPQAGVAIGLAALCARTLGEGIGTDLQTIILASSVLYEMIGPACAKLSLYLSGSYSNKLEQLTEVSETTAAGEPKPSVEILIERIQQIQEELYRRNLAESAEEDAFTQAAEEHYAAMNPDARAGQWQDNDAAEEHYAAISYARKGRFLNHG